MAQPLKKYRAAIIGCGRVAWMLENDPLEIKPCTHMGAYRKVSFDIGRVEVVAAADLNGKKLEAFGHRFGVGSLYKDYRAMLETERPEILSICAYAPDRFTMVMDSIDAGVKGIWCEKAFATTLEEGRMMKEALEENGVSLIVSHLRRWSADYRKAKEIIENGSIGGLQSIVCHFSGSLIHTGTHAFDILGWFGGPVDWVQGELEKSRGELPWDNIEDIGGRAFIKFKNGVYATVHAESKGYFFFEFDIIGSHGRIRIGNNGLLEYYLPKDSTHYTGLKELLQEEFPSFENKNIWTEALTHLLDCVDGNNESIDGAQEGIEALEMALAIHESARQDGSKVYLPLESKIKVRSR